MVHFGKYAGMRELALFAGAGGGILGGKMLGWRTVCAVEIEKYPRSVLLQRQKDGILDKFPIWDDVRTFDGRPWSGKVDVISGGFPCQDISSAGKGLGIERGERSGLWREYARIICEVRPRYCFVENSPMLTVRGLGIVLGDLAALGYDAAWKVLSAGDCGAPHERARMWIVAKDTDADGAWELQPQGTVEEQRRRPCDIREGVADAAEPRLQERNGEQSGEVLAESERLGCEVADAMQNGLQRRGKDGNIPRQIGLCCGTRTDEIEYLSDAVSTRERRNAREEENDESVWQQWWKAEPGLGRVVNAVANRVDRIKSIGNGQVPIVAARAFCELMEILENRQ